MLTAIVVAHPDRIEWAEQLATDIDATIVLDTEGLGAGGNHRRALQVGIDSGATHILVLEDDALPVPNLRHHVLSAIVCRPDQIIGLYVGRQRPRADKVGKAVAEADRIGASWLTRGELLWGVATIWPAALARDFLAVPQEKLNLWDTFVARWCDRTGVTVAYCWPSLVGHRDSKPVVRGRLTRTPGRTAHRIGIPDWNDIEVAV